MTPMTGHFTQKQVVACIANEANDNSLWYWGLGHYNKIEILLLQWPSAPKPDCHVCHVWKLVNVTSKIFMYGKTSWWTNGFGRGTGFQTNPSFQLEHAGHGHSKNAWNERLASELGGNGGPKTEPPVSRDCFWCGRSTSVEKKQISNGHVGHGQLR